MPYIPKTGNTATIAFGTSAFAAQYKQIGGTKQSRAKLEDTYLASTTRKTYVPAPLIEPGEFEIEYYWNHAFSPYPPISSATETITITLPLQTGQSTPATLVGTGFWEESEGPTLVNDALSMGKGKVAWDGKTGPTYTAGS